MATFLVLCQDLQREAGVSGNTLPSVLNQTGEFGRLVQWVKLAWQEIQVERRDWAFMWREFAESLASGTDTFDIRPNSEAEPIQFAPGPLLLTRSNGQKRAIQVLEHQYYVDRTTGSDRPAGIPTAVAALPDGKIRFDVPLLETVTLSGRYYLPIQTLAANLDVPQMPSRYHNAILYRALRKYAIFEEAEQLRQYAAANEEPWYQAMIREQLPRIMVGSQPLEGSPAYRDSWLT